MPSMIKFAALRLNGITLASIAHHEATLGAVCLCDSWQLVRHPYTFMTQGTDSFWASRLTFSSVLKFRGSSQ